MIEKVAKSEKSSAIETWHRYNRTMQLKNNLKNPFRRILEKKMRQLKRCK